jgi:hypothetical protein
MNATNLATENRGWILQFAAGNYGKMRAVKWN